nr:hypothetical protein Iba_chr10fCG8470 [Ipomoea batatas]
MARRTRRSTTGLTRNDYYSNGTGIVETELEPPFLVLELSFCQSIKAVFGNLGQPRLQAARHACLVPAALISLLFLSFLSPSKTLPPVQDYRQMDAHHPQVGSHDCLADRRWLLRTPACSVPWRICGLCSTCRRALPLLFSRSRS